MLKTASKRGGGWTRPIYGRLWILLTDIPALREPRPQSFPLAPSPSSRNLESTPAPSGAAASKPVPRTLPLRGSCRPQNLATSTRSPSCGPVHPHVYSCLSAPPPRVQVKDTEKPQEVLVLFLSSRVHGPCFSRGEPEPSGRSCFLRRILLVVPGRGGSSNSYVSEPPVLLFRSASPPLCPPARGAPRSEHRGQGLPKS